MAAFEHVTSLLAFVYALALTHLLARIVGLYDVRKRVTFSWLHALMVINAVLTAFDDWLALWPLRLVNSWDYLSIADNFVLAILLFFTCAIAAPERSEGQIDLEAYYWHARRPFYWLILTGDIVGEFGNLDFLKSSDPALFWQWTLGGSFVFLPLSLALAVPARWAQWTAALLYTAFCVVGGLVMENVH